MKLASSLSVLGLLAAIPRADVLVVDYAGGGDFTTLTAAVAAAADHDVLLVQPGFYPEPAPILIDDKPLEILGEAPSTPFGPDVAIQPGFVIRNLGVGRHVTLQNLLIYGTPSTDTVPPIPGLQLSNNTGHVRVQASSIRGGGGGSNALPAGGPALEISACATVALVGADVVGGPGRFSSSIANVTGNGGPGIAVSASELVVYGGVVHGGAGGGNEIGAWPQGGHGASGITTQDGTVYLSGAVIEGGEGGTAHNGGDGGAGVEFGSGADGLFMAGSLMTGGAGGLSDAGPGGSSGAPLVDPFAVTTDIGGTPHGFDVESPLHAGEIGALAFGGNPGDSILLLLGAEVHDDPYAVYHGALLVSPQSIMALTLPFPGNLSLDFTAPALVPGLEALELHMQPAYYGVDGIFLGPARVLTLLN